MNLSNNNFVTINNNELELINGGISWTKVIPAAIGFVYGGGQMAVGFATGNPQLVINGCQGVEVSTLLLADGFSE